MQDFLEPIFEFMSGNFVILNIIILYGIPLLIGGCGFLAYITTENKFVNSIGTLLILLSAVICCVLGFYAIINGVIITAICGFMFAGAIVYYLFNKNELPNEIKADDIDEVSNKIKTKADYGDIESLIKIGKEHFITDKNTATHYFEQAANKGDAEAQYRLGRVYYEFLDRKQEGIEWLKKSAVQNYKYAIDKLNNISEYYKYEEVINKNSEEKIDKTKHGNMITTVTVDYSEKIRKYICSIHISLWKKISNKNFLLMYYQVVAGSIANKIENKKDLTDNDCINAMEILELVSQHEPDLLKEIK